VVEHLAGVGWVYRVAFSPDGRSLAWSTSQQLVHIRDVHGRRTKRTLRGHQIDIHGLAWSPDSRLLASGDGSGRVALWDPATGKERLTLRGDPTGADSLAFTPDGKTLVGDYRDTVILWRVAPQPDWATFAGNTGFAAVALTQDGRTLAGATKEKTVRLWDLESRKDRTLQLGSGMGTSVAFAPGGALLAVGVRRCDESGRTLQQGGECQLWDPAGNKLVATLKSGADHAVTAVQFTPDGRWLLTGDLDGKVRLFDAAARREVAVLPGHAAAVTALAVSADGATLATAGGAEVKLWDLARRGERATLRGHQAAALGLAFLDEGRTLASAGLDRTVKLWDVASGQPRAALLAQPEPILSLAVSPDGQTLALGCQDRTVKLWDVRSGQLRAVLSGHTREVNAVAFSSDGRLLVSAAAANASWWVKGGEIKIWKADR
jgi:WD40 repeat protein